MEKTITCNSCGHAEPADALLCGKCGASLAEAREELRAAEEQKAAKRSENTDNGCSLANGQAAEKGEGQAPAPKARKKTIPNIIAAAVVVVAVAATFALGLFGCAADNGEENDGLTSYQRLFKYGPYPAKESESGAWGFIDEKGDFVIEPSFQKVYQFSKRTDGLAGVRSADGAWGFIDTEGNYVVEPQYVDAESFSEGLAAVRKDDKWGYIDTEGKIAIDFNFTTRPGRFSDGLAAAKDSNGKWGYIDKTGKFVIEAQYGLVMAFEDGVAAVSKGSSRDDLFQLIDKDGIVVSNFPGSTAVGAGQNNTYFYLFTHYTKDGSTTTRYSSSSYYSDDSGRYILWSNDLVPVTIPSGESFYLSKEGTPKITAGEYRFACLTLFTNGRAGFQDAATGLWGFIDSSGKVLCEPKFLHIESNGEDHAWVLTREFDVETSTQRAYALVDYSGNLILDVQMGFDPSNEYTAISFSDSDLIAFTKADTNNSVGFMDSNGNVVIEPQFYTLISNFPADLSYAEVMADNLLVGFIDKNGDWLVEPRFSGLG